MFNLKTVVKGAIAIGLPLALVGFVGTMNSGQALTNSSFDAVVTTLNGILSSTWTIMLAVIVLIVAVWQITHGAGYKTLGLIIAVLAVAIIGPSMITSLAKAMPAVDAIQTLQTFVRGV